MAARKNRPVLYEVVGRSYRGREQAPRRDPADDVEEVRPVREPPPAEPPRENEPRSIRFIDGRLIADLGWQGMTVAGVVAVILLAVAFDAGRRTATKSETPAPASSNTDEQSGDMLANNNGGSQVSLPPPGNFARDDTPPARDSNDEDFAQGEPEQPRGESAAAPTGTFTPQPGVLYVAIQHFPKSKLEDARKAGAFLMANGVDCVVVQRSDEIRLIATQPFSTERATEPLRAKIRQLGKQYKSDGRYDFAGCYPLMLKAR